MPLMDLTTPVELYAVEVLRDSNGRAQAYFTFLNCAAQPIASLYATLTLLDDAGAGLGSLPLRCEGLSAPGHSRFTVCRAMDDAPPFAGARALVREAVFADGTVWRIDENAVLDCAPPARLSDPDRVALVAVAGPDAVCFPQCRGNVWVCVCGRFNRMEWTACRRCQRERDDTLRRFTPERTHAAYEQKLARELAAERAHRAASRLHVQQEHTARIERIDRELRRQKRRRILLALLVLLAVSLCVLLVLLPDLYASQPVSVIASFSTETPSDIEIADHSVVSSPSEAENDGIWPPIPSTTPSSAPTLEPQKTGNAFG